MNKFLTSKQFGVAIILIVSILGILGFLNLAFEPNYTTAQIDQSITITLENGQYFILRPEADYIQEIDGNMERPFGGLNNRQFNAAGIDYFFLRRSYTQVISYTDNSRIISINPMDSNSFELVYTIATNLNYADTAKYVTQIDYSTEAEFKIDGDTTTINDGVCSTTLIDDNLTEVKKLNDFPSIELSQNYSDLITFKIKFEITCTE